MMLAEEESACKKAEEWASRLSDQLIEIYQKYKSSQDKNKFWKQRVDKLRNDIEENIEKIDSRSFENIDKAEIQKIKNKLANNLKELASEGEAFNAKRILVSCFGSLKAGKSTLMNALVGEDVCPIGASEETTLHCSAIMRADSEHPEGITFYRLSEVGCEKLSNSIKEEDGEGDDSKNCFSQMVKDWLNYLTGAKLDLGLNFQKSKRWDLKKENLLYLTKKSPMELQQYQDYVVAEIRVDVSKNVDEKNLLNQNVVLWDMPGLDGVKAGVDKNEPASRIIYEILNNSHYFLFVQSSISALNNTSNKILEEVLGKKKKGSPTILVFNNVDSKNWLSKNCLDKQLGDAYQRSIEQFPLIKTRMSVNAAKAWDGVSKSILDADLQEQYKSNHKQLLTESKIDDLREAIVNHAKQSLDQTIFEDASNGLHWLVGDEKNDKSFCKWLRDLENKISRKVLELNEIYDVCGRFGNDIRLVKEDVLNKNYKAWRRELYDELNRIFPQNNTNELNGSVNPPAAVGKIKVEVLEYKMTQYLESLRKKSLESVNKSDCYGKCKELLLRRFNDFVVTLKDKYADQDEVKRIIENADNDGHRNTFGDDAIKEIKRHKLGYENVDNFIKAKKAEDWLGFERKLSWTGYRKNMTTDAVQNLRDEYFKTYDRDEQIQEIVKVCYAPFGAKSIFSSNILDKFCDDLSSEVDREKEYIKKKTEEYNKLNGIISVIKNKLEEFDVELTQTKE